MKPQRPRYCPKCKEPREWQKVRPLGSRAGFRACLTCGSRTRPRQPGTKKRPKTQRKLLVEQLDVLARARAHARGACEMCGKTKNIQWAHGFGRSYWGVRWVDDNGRCLCYGCHKTMTHKHEEWREWLRAKLGDARFEEFRARRNDSPDYQATLEALLAGREVR